MKGAKAVTTKDLREDYASMDETTLLQMAKFGYTDLGFEAKEVLKSELARRGLLAGKTLFLINRQEDGTDEIEIKAIAVHIQNQICPHCSRRRVANGFVLTRRYGLVVVLLRREELVVGCKPCLLKAQRRRTWTSALALIPSLFLPLIPYFVGQDRKLQKRIQEASEDIPSSDLLDNIRRNIKTYRDILF